MAQDYPYSSLMKAYMFINSMRGQSLALTKAIRGVGGVLSADAITGDYDIIASVEVRDLTELRTAMAGVQGLDGVLKTTTCMVLSD
jgi:DNA-binding Lrp family transcriptional regulator